jgi:hypothetical protein
MIAPHPAETAPKDGRVIRGWFRFDGGAQLIAVSWDRNRSTWVNLTGEPVSERATLKNWGED